MAQKKYITLLCILIIAFLASGVQALSITAGPDHIEEGGQITVTIQGLEDGSSFSMHIGADIVPEENQEFAFSSNNLNMPFTLSDTTVIVQAEPIIWTNFRYQQDSDSPIKSLGFGSDDHPVRDGVINDEESFGLINGGSEIAMLEITGKALPEASLVSISLELNGVKSGVDDSSISYTINNMDQGTATIIVSVDGTEALHKKIEVGEAIPTTVPTAVPTQSSSGGDDVEYSANPTATPDTAAQDTEITASSIDGYAALNALTETMSGAEAEDIVIMKNSHPKDIPDEWELVYGAYVLSPASLRFSEPADFSITGDEGLETNARFIAEYKNGEWTILPTELKGNTLVAKISESGTYALMTFENTESVPETTAPLQTPVDTDGSASPEPSIPTPTASGLPLYAGIFTALGALFVVQRLVK
ncbi:hypothetical protein L1S32_00880 [Methanogenium sp. S4BF]|uniref:hypothetical protein n=1 Tax=Methanogenium sp. S4BF TaxID=1789226 RepID=UPI002416296A|nr:hypothetical protein [Methanogenium sp. S4BF]WFN34708.1 hypothetical protein L1S32_00880 [Methanogenium sp. S4BF]